MNSNVSRVNLAIREQVGELSHEISLHTIQGSLSFDFKISILYPYLIIGLHKFCGSSV